MSRWVQDINLELRHAAARQMCEFWYCGGSAVWLSSPVVRLFTRPQGRVRDHTDHKTQLHKHCRRARLQQNTELRPGGLWDNFSDKDEVPGRHSRALVCDSDIKVLCWCHVRGSFRKKFSLCTRRNIQTKQNPESITSECITDLNHVDYHYPHAESSIRLTAQLYNVIMYRVSYL